MILHSHPAKLPIGHIYPLASSSKKRIIAKKRTRPKKLAMVLSSLRISKRKLNKRIIELLTDLLSAVYCTFLCKLPPRIKSKLEANLSNLAVIKSFVFLQVLMEVTITLSGKGWTPISLVNSSFRTLQAHTQGYWNVSPLNTKIKLLTVQLA